MTLKLLFVSALLLGSTAYGQNPLVIPPAITTSNMTLTLQEGVTQFYPGVNTSTMGANGALLGPNVDYESRGQC